VEVFNCEKFNFSYMSKDYTNFVHKIHYNWVNNIFEATSHIFKVSPITKG